MSNTSKATADFHDAMDVVKTWIEQGEVTK